MGVLKSAADLVYTIRFLKLLVTPFEETGAYEAGIIDENGKRNKSFNTNSIDDRNAYKENYTAFHRLVFNIKRLMAKVPGGKSKLASYAAALYLIKEHGNLSSKNLIKINEKLEIDEKQFLGENNKWYVLKDGQLSPGIYRIETDSLTEDYLDIVNKGDKIRISEDNYPVDNIFGIDVYQGVHINSNRKLFVSAGQLIK